ncbi:uncharacterized protein PV09_02812 [Verruconis gallopava]|uniref:MARVEL domain-containing protein n=1 Tax=Verruconis gallopava TaxID=253628 RepID=A0A0D2AIG4_9PEZI|nr:uncharacterized protein PV09_02812 [Verruconis gallopava]KIW06350.1 hypothetical protein PV09_02812 [Verruconis gallopava]
MGFGGAALKLVQTILYAIAFCCSAIILGFYSYFLAVQSDRNVHIPQWQKAVEGMSGIGVVYTIFAVVLTCCLGGVAFFAFLAIVLDVLLCAAFIAIAVLLRDGADKCSGTVHTPLGTGPANTKGSFGQNGFGTGSGENVTYAVSLHTACIYNKACFAVAIIGAFVFAISAFMQVWLGRHHRKEKKFGPGPNNNYTAGSGSRWFSRKRGPKTTHDAYAKDAEAAGALGVPPADIRPSQETGYTGTTAGMATDTYTGNKYEPHQTHVPQAQIPTTGGYHTAPTGTGVNPYGYENKTAGTNF